MSSSPTEERVNQYKTERHDDGFGAEETLPPWFDRWLGLLLVHDGRFSLLDFFYDSPTGGVVWLETKMRRDGFDSEGNWKYPTFYLSKTKVDAAIARAEGTCFAAWYSPDKRHCRWVKGLSGRNWPAVLLKDPTRDWEEEWTYLVPVADTQSGFGRLAQSMRQTAANSSCS